jgi:hypothetical protein
MSKGNKTATFRKFIQRYMGLSFSISKSHIDLDPLLDHRHSRSGCAMLGSSLIRD